MQHIFDRHLVCFVQDGTGGDDLIFMTLDIMFHICGCTLAEPSIGQGGPWPPLIHTNFYAYIYTCNSSLVIKTYRVVKTSSQAMHV
jgi:hypothetical protein